MNRRSKYLADLFATIFDQRPAFRTAVDGRPIIEQCRDLISARGEAATMRLAESILATYQGLSSHERLAFFDYLADELDLDAVRLEELAGAYRESPTTGSLKSLMQAAEPARQELFRRLNQSEGATAQLVSMRADLLTLIADHPQYGRIDLDFAHLFTSWFNRGFLVLRRIDWDTPASILEKIIAYEAVHEINDWDDLRRRIQPADRRCYAYFHPRVPNDPLIFVAVALTKGVPTSVQDVLATGRTALEAGDADTAVFYSISNCQRGLHGISFGDSLIKQVVADLSSELPGLRTFITLSPLPGLRRWLETQAGEADPRPARIIEAVEAADDDADALDSIGDDLREMAAVYLAVEKRPDGRPVDAVARFHLANGAQIDNILTSADLSPNGIAQSVGAMVNYRYDPQHVETNCDAFATKQTVALSRSVQALVRAKPKVAAPAR